MQEKSTNDVEWYEILGVCVASILGAAIWPFIYPVLDFVLALLGIAESPGLVKAIMEFGPIYGKSETAPGFFKGMAEGAQLLSGEHPQIASLPYMAKVNLLFYINLPCYAVELLVFVFVVVVSLLSRILPWKLAANVVQRIAIGLAMLPFVAISLWCMAFFLLAFFQAWQFGILHAVLFVLISPAVALRVVSPHIGVFLLAYGLVPFGLTFAGRGSLARAFLLKFPHIT